MSSSPAIIRLTGRGPIWCLILTRPLGICIAVWCIIAMGMHRPKARKIMIDSPTAALWRLANRALSLPILALIWGYKLLISPLLGANCRHLPTCSEYTQDALRLHGPLRGGYYAVKRMARCHPWATPAFDPVPPACSQTKSARAANELKMAKDLNTNDR